MCQLAILAKGNASAICVYDEKCNFSRELLVLRTYVHFMVYWTNKVRDQTFNVQYLQDFELLVK